MLNTGMLKGVFAALSLLSLLVALGVFNVPQLAAPLVPSTDLRVDGVPPSGVESIVWNFNPDMNMVHFELTLSSVENYLVRVYTSQPTDFKDVEGVYRLQPFTLSFDLSDLKTAVPMQSAGYEDRVYYYEFVDCTKEVDPNPQDVFTYLAAIISPANLVSGLYGMSVNDILSAPEYQRVVAQSWENCRSEFSTLAPQSQVMVFMGIQKVTRPVVIPIVNIQVASYDFPKPDFFAVVAEPLPTYRPRTVGQVYPVGSVKFYLAGQRGGYTATVNINVSDLNASQINKQVSASFGNIFFSFYAFSSGDLFAQKGDPVLYQWHGGLMLIHQNDLSRVEDLRVNIDNYLSSNLYARDYFLGRLSDISSVSFKAYATFSEALSQTAEIKSTLKQMVENYDTALNTASQRLSDIPGASFNEYVLILPDNPVESHYMRLRFVGDIRADYIGLTYLKTSPKIADVRVVSQPNNRQPLMVSYVVRNQTDVRGSVEAYLSCSRLGTASDAFTLPAGGEVERTIILYPPNLTERFDDTCTLSVCNVDHSVCDSRSLSVSYTPALQCQPNTSWCSPDGTAIQLCEDPYAGTIKTIPCGETETCVVEGAAAKCVPKSTIGPEEVNATLNCTCRQGGLLCFNPAEKKFEFTPCPEGQTCVVDVNGARCEAVPVPVPPAESKVTFIERTGSTRLGFAILSIGFLLLAVIL